GRCLVPLAGEGPPGHAAGHGLRRGGPAVPGDQGADWPGPSPGSPRRRALRRPRLPVRSHDRRHRRLRDADLHRCRGHTALAASGLRRGLGRGHRHRDQPAVPRRPLVDRVLGGWALGMAWILAVGTVAQTIAGLRTPSGAAPETGAAPDCSQEATGDQGAIGSGAGASRLVLVRYRTRARMTVTKMALVPVVPRPRPPSPFGCER